MICVNNAATTKISDLAFEKILPFLREHYSNASSQYSLGTKAKRAVEQSRRQISLWEKPSISCNSIMKTKKSGDLEYEDNAHKYEVRCFYVWVNIWRKKFLALTLIFQSY